MSYAVKVVGGFHRDLVMGNDDELCLDREIPDYLEESAAVGIIKRSVNFIENAKRRWLDKVESKQQRNSCQRSFAARHHL